MTSFLGQKVFYLPFSKAENICVFKKLKAPGARRSNPWKPMMQRCFIQNCVSSCIAAPEVADVRVDAWEVTLCARNHSPRDNSGQLQSPVLILSRVINTIANSLISWFLKIPSNMWFMLHYLNIFPAFNLDWQCPKCNDHMKTFCQKLVSRVAPGWGRQRGRHCHQSTPQHLGALGDAIGVVWVYSWFVLIFVLLAPKVL